MRSAFLAGAMALGLLGSPTIALAASNCTQLSNKAKDLDESGQLTLAALAAGDCMKACDEEQNTAWADKCKERYDALGDALPSVVFEVFDATGTPTTQASVSVKDEKGTTTPVTATINSGRAYPFDPGIYTFVVTLGSGGAPKETTISLKRGIKRSTQNTPVSVSFKPDVPPPPPPQPAKGGGVPVWAWVVGGIGVASLVPAAVFLGLSIDGQDKITANCKPPYDVPGYSEEECTSSGLGNDNNMLQIASGVFFGVAGAGVLIGIVGIATAPKAEPKAAAIEFVPVAGPGIAGGLLRGAF